MNYNLNGVMIRNKHLGIDLNNRGLNYGDGIFETMKYANGRINFWEDHYFRLMSSMRIVRMEIPMDFSPEFLEEEIRKTLRANDLENEAARVKLLAVRKAGGLYTPQTNDIDYLITVEKMVKPQFELNEEGLEIDLFKDYYKPKGLLSNLKSTSAQFYTIASVFKKENKLDELVLINPDKNVVEAISSNIFILNSDKSVMTPPLESGCLKGVMRKNVIKLLQSADYEVNEEDFNPFALQRAEEVFLTNSIHGVRWVKKYRKKEFGNYLSQKLAKRLNVAAALGND